MTKKDNLEFFGLDTSYRNHALIHNKDGGNYGTGDHTGMVQRIEAGRSPTANDDESDSSLIGIRVLIGALWINKNTGDIFFCTNASIGAATWVSAGGGGAGSINLFDETTDLGPVDNIRAVGVDVSASVVGTDGYLYIPPASFAPNYNVGGCTIPSIATTNRHVSNPTTPGTPFDIGSWTAGSIQPCHQDTANTNYNTPVECSFEDNTSTTFEVTIYGADGVTPIASYTTPIINGNGVHSGSNITVTVTSWASEFLRYKADVDVRIGVGAILPNGGRYSIEIVHHNAGTDYTKTQGPMFMDQESAVAVLSGVSIVENSPVTKILSGVTHYTLGSTFDANIADIDNINDSSYPTNFLSLDGADYALALISRDSTGMTGWTNVWNNVDSSFDEASWAITMVGISTISTTASISARTEDWASGGWISSPVNSILVDTLLNGSSGILEDFTTENSRLTLALGGWDNTQDLTTYDGGTGLQVSGGRLVYPVLDFTTYDPNPVGQPNYSGLSGDREFYSHFEHSGVSHSNGILEISDYNITESDITNGDVVIEISLDGASWYNCGNNYGGGPLVDGDGCRINSGTNNLGLNNRIQFTLGAGGSTNAGTGTGWGIYYRITFTDTDTNNYIGELQIVDWV